MGGINRMGKTKINKEKYKKIFILFNDKIKEGIEIHFL